MDYVFVVNHSNLRTDDGSMLAADAKHIQERESTSLWVILNLFFEKYMAYLHTDRKREHNFILV